MVRARTLIAAAGLVLAVGLPGETGAERLGSRVPLDLLVAPV
jgi:hypothetical protein